MDCSEQLLGAFGPWSEEALPLQSLPPLPQPNKEKKASIPRCESVDQSRALATEGCEWIDGEHLPTAEFLLPANTALRRGHLPAKQLIQRQPNPLCRLSPAREVRPPHRAILYAPILVPIRSSVGMVHSLPIKKPGKLGAVRKLQDMLPPQIREVKKVGALLRKRTKPQIAIFHKGFPPYRRTVEYNLFRNVRKYAFNRSLSGLI